jgi:hypothetical protein
VKSTRVKVVYAKVTNLSAYRRKRLIRRNKMKLITLGMLAVITSTAILFGEGINDTLNDQTSYIMMAPYSSQ